MTDDTFNLSGLLVMLAALLGVIALTFPDPEASGAMPADLTRVVCEAGATQDPITEAGQYGPVWRQTCHVGTIDGAPVSVFFID